MALEKFVGKTMRGRVCSLTYGKPYGYVKTELGYDVWFHCSDGFEGFNPYVGDLLEFEIELSPQGRSRAVNLRYVEGFVPPEKLRVYDDEVDVCQILAFGMDKDKEGWFVWVETDEMKMKWYEPERAKRSNRASATWEKMRVALTLTPDAYKTMDRNGNPLPAKETETTDSEKA